MTTESMAQDCGKCPLSSSCESGEGDVVTKAQIKPTIQKQITFIEIGSVTCIPCQKMQPVMKAIEQKYGMQIKVVFHDVKKDKAVAEKYNIRVIPTQIFIDDKGKEIFRHEGFYPEGEIDKLLQANGLKIVGKI
jgi:thioredoxin 1